MDLRDTTPDPESAGADPLGLGLGQGLGGDAASELNEPEPKQSEPGKAQKLLIKTEC